jgi:hypothetical protein
LVPIPSTFTEDAGFVVDYIAEVDADTLLHAAIGIDGRISLRHHFLDDDRALNSVHDTAKLRQNAVISALMGANEEANVARDVGSENCGQFAGNLWISRDIRHPEGNQFDFAGPI